MDCLLSKNLYELQECIKIILENENVRSALIFIADGLNVQKEVLDPILQGIHIPVIGGIFPQIVFKSQLYDNACMIVPLDFEIKAKVINLSEGQTIISEVFKSWYDEYSAKNNLFVFVDAFSQNKNALISTLFNTAGISLKYLGGGAGSLSFLQKPCVLDNTGLYENSAVLGLFDAVLSIGVAHGWTAISEPLKITEAIGNKLISIDWEPAFDVYKQYVETHSGQRFTENNFFDIAKSYPFGMLKLDAEMVVRDPLQYSGTDLLIVDSIPQGEYIMILHGNINSLLAGAFSAKEQARNHSQAFTFFIDCISRVMYMADNFNLEINNIAGDNDAWGILTIGEIANSGESFLEIYNKTCVVAKWSKMM